MGQLSQTTLRHLRWMLQKDILKQDIFLIGRPGPTRRHLAMIFLEMAGREVEYVSLSRDTTEADLKQRREISSGTAKYFDQVRFDTESNLFCCRYLYLTAILFMILMNGVHSSVKKPLFLISLHFLKGKTSQVS